MLMTSSPSVDSVVSASVVTVRSVGSVHDLATALSEDERWSEESRREVIWVAEVSRSLYRVLRQC